MNSYEIYINNVGVGLESSGTLEVKFARLFKLMAGLKKKVRSCYNC